MKKQIIAAVLVTGLVTAGVASANWNRGGRGMNYQDCPQYNNPVVQQQLDPAVQEKMDKFFDDTTELRKEIAMKQAEKRALMRGDNPDPGTVAKLTGELFDLRNTMRTKAEEAGVEQYVGPRGPRGGMMGGKGGGRGNGRMQQGCGGRGWN